MGIGLVTAKLLSQKGARLVLVARSKDKLVKLAKQLPDAIAIAADVSNVEEIKKMVKQAYEHFGRIDILVNNAGQGYDVPVEKIDPAVFHYLFDLDVLASASCHSRGGSDYAKARRWSNRKREFRTCVDASRAYGRIRSVKGGTCSP